MENLSGNLALILIGFVVIMHFAVWLEAILYRHGWQKILAFTALLTVDIFFDWAARASSHVDQH